KSVDTQSTPTLDITASIIDEHSVHFIVLTDATTWGFNVGINDSSCKSLDSSIAFTGNDCDINFETAFNGSAILKWTNISSGVGRLLEITRVSYFSNLSNVAGGFINQTFNFSFCTAPEAAADITFTGQSDRSILMNLTLEDNAEAGGFTYQLEKWNGAKWVVETASGNSTSTSAKASISTWGAVYRATVNVEDACDGYTLSENATTGIFQADLEVPAEDPVLLSTTDGNYMCFLWRYTNPNSQFNLARAQFFQSGTGKDVFTQAGVS
ncbi:uncharacterized protein LOC142358171, partial [Convolutriloba macropyga]|uniref:uncharacterized protein LOC142358171 n=1 Tax=Convolutriloba macropyga TaxID=536237 RepID=UPI003F521CA3